MNEQNRIAEIVLTVVRGHVSQEVAVTPDCPLFDGGLGLDSVGFLELILKIEKAVGFRLRDEDLTEEAFSSVGNLIRHIERLAAKMK